MKRVIVKRNVPNNAIVHIEHGVHVFAPDVPGVYNLIAHVNSEGEYLELLFEHVARYLVRDRLTGTTLDDCKTLKEAQMTIKRFEKIDHDLGQYVPDYYEIYDTVNECVL